MNRDMLELVIALVVIFGLFLLFVSQNNDKYHTPKVIIWTVEEK